MIELAVLYAVLRDVARRKDVISYEDLSRLYHEAAGDWHDPEGTWDVPLAGLNGRTRAAGLPPISAVVTSKPRAEENFGPPGDGGFWGSPGVPPRPARVADRLMIWMGFVNLAYRAAWPENLPGLATPDQ
jgi:hypothetical protein